MTSGVTTVNAFSRAVASVNAVDSVYSFSNAVTMDCGEHSIQTSYVQQCVAFFYASSA